MKKDLMSSKQEATLREIEAVLEKYGASLYFDAPARLWIDGREVCQVWHADGSDGSRLESVEQANHG